MDRLSAEDNAARQSALNWVNTATRANQWRLQVLSKRYRKDPVSGKRRAFPVKIRRFLEGCPPSCIREALDIILEQAPYSGILYNGNVVPGLYRPTLTEWRRDDNSVINGQQRTDGTYTLIQDLVENDSDESWTGRTSSDCTEEVVSEYHWDEPDIGPLPVPEQGITYAIQQVSRAEDGTFNYVLVKRTAKTQITDESVQDCNEFETTTVQTWRNVYGTPESPVDHSGVRLDIPAPCSSEDGTIIERKIQPNADCTYDIVVQKRTSSAVDASRTTAATVFQRDVSVERKSQTSPLPDAPAASGGVVRKHKSDLRPDGKYDTVESTTTEKETLRSTVVVSVTRKGKRTSVTDRNQKSPASTLGLPVGTEVRTEKTEGGLHNNTVTTWEPTDRGKVAEKCQSDLFTHTDEETSTVPDMPMDHVSGGGVDGHVISRTTSVDDDTGIVTQTVTDRKEKPVARSVQRWATTTRGTTYEERNTNQPTAPSHPGTVGSSTVVERTEGGLYTYTVRQFEASVQGDMGFECSKTIFSHVHRTLTNSASPYTGHVPAASNGLVTSVTSRRNEDGGYDQTVENRQDLPVVSAVVETLVSLHGRRKTTVNRNMVAPAEGSGKIGSSVRNEKTDSGLVTQTIVEADIHDVGMVKEDCVRSASEHRHSTTSNVAKKPQAEVTRSDGTIREKTVSATEYGTYDVTEATRTAVALSTESDFGTVLQKTTQKSFRNQKSVSVSPGRTNVETRASLSKNEFGLVDGTTSTTKYIPHTFGPLLSGNVFAEVETKFGKNVTSVPSMRGKVNQDGAISASANDHGSYDYTVRMTTYQSVGPVTIATSDGILKGTEIKFARNNVEKPNVTGTTNQDISISATMNDHGSYDWSARVDTFKPYGPITVAVTTGILKSTTVESAYNQTSVSQRNAVQNQDISISASMNSHGSFDWTARTDTYHPYGPITVAEAVGVFKTTVVESAYNQTTVGKRKANKNQDISISASMNSHGSFDWTCRTDTYKPYGPVVIAQTVGTLKSTVVKSAYNQDSISKQTAKQNQDISISASMNSHGSFDWTCRTDTYNPYGPVVVAQATGIYKSTVVKSAYNQPKPGMEVATTNQEVSVSASLNQHGTFDWTARVDTYNPYAPTLVSQTSTPVVDTMHYVGFNNVDVVSNATGNASSSMSVSMNQHGTFDTHEVVRVPKFVQKEGSWTTYTANGSSRSHRIIVYRNADSVLTLDGGTQANAGASINEFGLVDGSATCTYGDDGDGLEPPHFTTTGETVEQYRFFQERGGRPMKQRMTATKRTKCDLLSSVAPFCTDAGPWRGSLTKVGRVSFVGVGYTNYNLHAPEPV